MPFYNIIKSLVFAYLALPQSEVSLPRHVSGMESEAYVTRSPRLTRSRAHRTFTTPTSPLSSKSTSGTLITSLAV